MFKVIHDPLTGRFAGVQRDESNGATTSFGEGSTLWPDFQRWNAAQPVPLDLSDRAPSPLSPEEQQRQTDRQTVAAYIQKRRAGTATAQDRANALESALNLIGG